MSNFSCTDGRMIRTDCSFFLAAFASSDKSKLLQKRQNIFLSIVQGKGKPNIMKVVLLILTCFLFIKKAIQKNIYIKHWIGNESEDYRYISNNIQ